MNILTTREHDKFSGITKTTTKEFSWGEKIFPLFSLCHTSTPNGEQLSLVVETIRHGPEYNDNDLKLYIYPEEGELIININHAKNIVFNQVEVLHRGCHWHEWHKSYSYKEVASYKMTKEQLLMICDAKSIEYKIVGGTSSIVYEDKPGIKTEYMGRVNIAGVSMNIPFQLHAKALYNAIYDNSAHLQELKELDKKIIAKKTEDEETTINTARTKTSVSIILIITILLSVGAIVTSIVVSSGTFFWIGIAGIVVSVTLLANLH